ncbi:MAG: ABC transporter permease [Lentisphaeraceae bacterium]|nr:ABC transporter permease [Lentisphaeraceae bacterium]
MTTYVIRRLLLVIPTFIGITMLVFAITRLLPGGPVEQMLAEARQQAMESGKGNKGPGAGAGDGLSEEQKAQLMKRFGLDKPYLVAYFHWFKGFFVGDLGDSFRYNEPVLSTIASKMPVSIFYGLLTMFFTYGICIPLGIVKALKHRTVIDNSTSIFVFFGYALPNYVVGTILLLLFAGTIELFPLGGFKSFEYDDLSVWGKFKDIVYHAVLPTIAYVAGSLAITTMLMKNSLMDNLASDYVRTALAKGNSFNESVFKHAFKNSLIPLATSFGSNITLILAGSFLVESVFNIDGFGLLGYEALLTRDYPVVMGVIALSSLLSLIGNILSDICVAMVDPRVKFE